MPETGAARLVVRPRYGGLFKPRSSCLFGLGSVWLFLSFSVSVGYAHMVLCCGVSQLAIWWRHSSAIIPGGAICLVYDGLSFDMISAFARFMFILSWGMCQLAIWWRLSSFDVLERTVKGGLFDSVLWEY